jgi:uncharacterized protein
VLDIPLLLLCFSFFAIALLYSSVGFGGGSSYLAVMSISFFALPFQQIKIFALICNILVVSGSSYRFYKLGFLDFRKIIPLILISIPAVFFGSKLLLSERIFFIYLGFSLILVAIILWFQEKIIKTSYNAIERPLNTYISMAIGGVIGFFSGMVGIGGGIFLSPILFFVNWDRAKKIAATASVFILVNSISGLFSISSNVLNKISLPTISALSISVIFGGWIGSNIMTKRFSTEIIQKVTAVLIFIASLNILNKYL